MQTRADLRAVVADVERLPEDQRAALVLAELADLSHEQIADVIGVRTGKVKALIHQARTTLIAERDARETPCVSVREELATARGGALRRGPLRRHLRLCDGCRAYRVAVDHQRRALALALPATPSLGLKAGILGAVSATGGAGGAAVGGGASGAAVGGASSAAVGGGASSAAVGGGASSAAVGGATAVGGGLAAKVVATAIIAGGAAAGGVAVVDHPGRPAPMRAPAAAHAPRHRAHGGSGARRTAPSAAGTSPAAVNRPLSDPGTTSGGSSSQPSAAPATAEHGQGQYESGGHGQGQGDGQARAKVRRIRRPSLAALRPSRSQTAATTRRRRTRARPRRRRARTRPAATKGKDRPAASIPPGQVKKHAASGPKHPPAAAKPEKAPKGKAPGAQPEPDPTPAPTAQPQSDNKPDKPGKSKSNQDDTASNTD